jgi:hypothetical protein
LYFPSVGGLKNSASAVFMEKMFVDGVFWYTKHVHYTLVWICLWNSPATRHTNHITSSSMCMHLEVLCLCRITWT